MQNRSPVRSTSTSSRRASVQRHGDSQFSRMQSPRSLATPRRALFDLAQVQGNAMKVYVRVRPFSERELSTNAPHHATVRIDVENSCLITLLDPNKDFRPRETFSFTRCLWSVLECDSGDSRADLSLRDSFLERRSSACTSPGSRGNYGRRVSNIGSPRHQGRVASSEKPPTFEGAGSNPAIVSRNALAHPPYSSQQDVYNEVGRPVLENTLEGYNGCVFAYGQTGSGKTFTMFGCTPKNNDFVISSRRNSSANNYYKEEGDDACSTKPSVRSQSPAFFRRTGTLSRQGSRHDGFSRQISQQGNFERHMLDIVDKTHLDPNELHGIIPRITTDLFTGLREKREKDPSNSYRVEVEYYEIYNEKVYDLIRPQKDADLKIRQHPVNGPYVEGLTSNVVTKEDQVAKIIQRGSIERHTAATKINDRSSRSHAIITFNVMQLYLDQNDNTCKKKSKLNLVDLAGSERTGAVGAEGKQFLEGTKINLSLTTLGRVIDCLADLSQSKSLSVPVPYRDSNLTWLLMDSLGGNSKTSMVATISPHSVNFEEMRQTIRYASRAKQIVNKAVINEDPQVRQIRMLTTEVERLKKVIQDAGHNEFTRDYVLDLQRRNSTLEKRCQDQEMTIAELRAGQEENGMCNRLDDQNQMCPRRARGAQQEMNLGRKQADSIQRDDNVSVLKTQLSSARVEVEELRRQLAAEGLSKRNGGGNETARVAELNVCIERLRKELNTLRRNEEKKMRTAEKFLSVYMSYTAELLHNMVQKEREFMRRVGLIVADQSRQISDAVGQSNQAHRTEMEKLRKRHISEMANLKKMSDTQVKDLTERSNEICKQLIDKHVEKINFLEDRMKKKAILSESEVKRSEAEKEGIRSNYEEQMAKMRANFQEELRRLRDQLNIGASDRQRSGEVIKRVQEEHEKEINRRQEEINRYRSEKEQEISRLKQLLHNETMRRENDMMEKDRQRRLVEEEVNEMRRELHKARTERNRMEQQHQADMQSIAQQQEKLISVGNGLLLDWDNRSAAIGTSFSELRSLLHSQDYINFRSRLRDAVFERKDYTAELEAVDERKRRDTERLREIVQQLKQNQEDSKASLQRFEEDVMKHLARVNKTHSSNVVNQNGESSSISERSHSSVDKPCSLTPTAKASSSRTTPRAAATSSLPKK